MEIQSQESQLLPPHQAARFNKKVVLKAFILLIVFIAGFGGGFFTGRKSIQMEAAKAKLDSKNKIDELAAQVNPPDGYQIPATFGNVGVQVVAAGGIDMAKFSDLYKQAGRPLSEQQLAILTTGSNEKIVINQDNAQFLLNFFWAVGLTNQNKVLTEGLMVENSRGNIGNYASTGGWTLGAKAATDLYASALLIPLTAEQQKLLVEVASAVYRPCCDNPTHFPDCNHGMAMLGLLELMASQNASADEMFEAAKYVNAFWFPQQMMETAVYLNATQNVDFIHAAARQVVGQAIFSGSGFQAVHQWLSDNGLLQQSPGGGGSCGIQ